jgi:D-cysteine desulfhydrase
VYTGKAFHALATELGRDRARFGASVTFIHTGGLFGTFAAPDLSAAVAAM